MYNKTHEEALNLDNGTFYLALGTVFDIKWHYVRQIQLQKSFQYLSNIFT